MDADKLGRSVIRGYCLAAAALVLAVLTAISATQSAYNGDLVVMVLSLQPVAIILLGLLGFWRFRWWGVIVLLVLSVGVLAWQFMKAEWVWNSNTLLFYAVFLLAPLVLAITYRRVLV